MKNLKSKIYLFIQNISLFLSSSRHQAEQHTADCGKRQGRGEGGGLWAEQGAEPPGVGQPVQPDGGRDGRAGLDGARGAGHWRPARRGGGLVVLTLV